jgi:hypothetical protein
VDVPLIWDSDVVRRRWRVVVVVLVWAGLALLRSEEWRVAEGREACDDVRGGTLVWWDEKWEILDGGGARKDDGGASINFGALVRWLAFDAVLGVVRPLPKAVA